MVLNVSTQDLENFPGTTKTVGLDISSVVPAGYEGDEQIVLSVATTAYSDVGARTPIRTKYLTGLKTGWCKSSGLTGTAGKYSIDSTHYKLKVKIDTTISGTDGSGYYTISLDYNQDNTPISGEDIAADIETKIRALGDSLVVADTGFTLAYKTCSAEYKNGKFWVISGSMGSTYTGAYRTSVKILAASTNDASHVLGFDLSIDSERIAGIRAKETSLGAEYTAGTDTIVIVTGTGAVIGDCLMITDGLTTDYFTAISGSVGDSSIKVATIGNNGYNGIANSYTVSGTKVQLLREQDPDGQPTSYLATMDDIARRGIKYMMSQIDYSA